MKTGNWQFCGHKRIVDNWVVILQMLYNHEIDEQLVVFRGKWPFRQYMSCKPAKHGIKFWVLCFNETNYAWNIQYSRSLESRLVLHMNETNFLGLPLMSLKTWKHMKLFHIFCPWTYSSEKKTMTIIGTIWKKTRITQQLLVKGTAKYPSTFAFTKNTTLVWYVPNRGKCVVLQSTLHNGREIAEIDTKIHQINLEYNCTKLGIDTLDNLASHYSCRKKTNRRHILVLPNILDISAITQLYCS